MIALDRYGCSTGHYSNMDGPAVTPMVVPRRNKQASARCRPSVDGMLLAYQGAGIPEYWIVDVAGKIVRIHRLTQAKSYSEETHAKGMIALQSFPDVTIDLGDFF
jgi:hypothetical protein